MSLTGKCNTSYPKSRPITTFFLHAQEFQEEPVARHGFRGPSSSSCLGVDRCLLQAVEPVENLRQRALLHPVQQSFFKFPAFLCLPFVLFFKERLDCPYLLYHKASVSQGHELCEHPAPEGVRMPYPCPASIDALLFVPEELLDSLPRPVVLQGLEHIQRGVARQDKISEIFPCLRAFLFIERHGTSRGACLPVPAVRLSGISQCAFAPCP